MITPYSKIRDWDRSNLGDQLPLGAPFAVHIETNNNCNFKCKFCPESFDDYFEQAGGKAKIDTETFRKIAFGLKELGRLKTLRFFMLGEPLLHKNIPGMIRIAKDMGLADKIELTTNATALSMDKCAALIYSGLDYLRVSIYATDQKRHEEITGSKIDINIIKDNLSTFIAVRAQMLSHKPFLYVKMIRSLNENENQRFLHLYRHLADECVLEDVMNWSGFEGRDLTLGGKTVAPYEKKICPYPFYTMVINANGDVTCCCVDWNKKTKVGNVKEESIKDIWHGARMREFRRMHVEGRAHENEACKNCTVYKTSPDNLDHLTQDNWNKILACPPTHPSSPKLE
jgi:radical SAM protein with 4Fe4S-binding SPASM domain